MAKLTSENIEEIFGVKDKDLKKKLLDARDAFCIDLIAAQKLPEKSGNLSEQLLLELLECSSSHTLVQKKDGLERLTTQLHEERRIS